MVNLRAWVTVAVVILGNQHALAATLEIDFDALVSSYRYTEPDVMSLRGRQAGLAGRVAIRLESDALLAAEGRYVSGKADYSSPESGTSAGEPNTIAEVRLLAGRRFLIGAYRVQPYTGFGLRKLVNDSAGMVTSTGDDGYRRVSNYRYLPLGVEGTHAGSGAKWTLGAEYNYLLRGTQVSYLSRETVSNRQNSGHGFRASLMLEQDSWSAGPYWQWWRIGESADASCFGGRSICYEPANRTREFGIVLRYRYLP